MTAADRPPLDPDRLSAAGPPWRVTVVEQTASTNADLLAEASGGEPEGAVLAAEHQIAGRGRLDRVWTSPPRAGLTVSLLLRPQPPTVRWGWLALMAGVALADTVGAGATVKWPNDLLLDGAKAAGVLVQSATGAVVVGVGLNVDTDAHELPVASATSLRLAGRADLDRTAILLDFLDRFGARYADWQRAQGDASACSIAADYRALCATIGAEVQVQLASSMLVGKALAVDDDGGLIVKRPDGSVTTVAAGDVTHVRPASM